MEMTAMQSRFLLLSGALFPLCSQGAGTEDCDLVRQILEPEAPEAGAQKINLTSVSSSVNLN